jgi:hypothetical protein
MLCLLLVKRRKKKKKKREREIEATGGVFFPRAGGWTHLAGCAGWDCHGCQV